MATKIPLVFGVTGHRDIPVEDFGKLENKIRERFRDHKKKFPATPLILLTSLAEGGDRIAANAALHEGVEIIPILPMPQAEYEKDFIDPSSLQDFRKLLSRASTPIIVRCPAERTMQPATRPGLGCDDLYQHAGIYVALHSNLLIAIWDGYFTDESGELLKSGGTAAIVKFRDEGVISGGHSLPAFCRGDATVLDAPESGPIIYIATRRSRSKRAPMDNPFAKDKTSSKGNRAAIRKLHSPEKMLTHLDVFNSDADRLGSSHADKIATSEGYLLPEPLALKHPALAELRSQFATADILAIVFRDRVQQLLLVISGFALAAFVSFELFAHIWETPLMLAAYLVILVIPWAVYLQFVRPRDWQGKYLDYRALAEALRVQFFWRMAGIPLNAADFYLRRQTGDLGWIRHAARVCNIGQLPEEKDADTEAVRKHWIVDQKKYFDKTARREERTFKWWDRQLIGAYLAGIIIAVLVLIALLENPTMPGLLRQISIVVMGLAPALAATIGFVLEHRAYESHVRQYDLMADLYGSADSALEKASDARDRRAIIEAIGREALAENGDWYFMHRERRVAPPRGG